MHNNWINTTTGLSPNQILLGYTPELAPSEAIKMDNKEAEKQVKCMIQAQDQATHAINKKAGGPPLAQFSIREQVWLEGTHLKLPHQSTKLALKQYGPFKITKQINPVTYQLMLPNTTPDPHLTLLEEKNSLKWSKFKTIDVMDDLECSSTSSNGKEAPKVTTHGSQLT